MNEITDFIGVYPNAISNDLCDLLIERFELMDELGFTRSRKGENPDTLLAHKDDQVLYTYEIPLQFLTKGEIIADFNTALWACYHNYAAKFEASITSASDEHTVSLLKLQRTRPGQGYHLWHYESSGRDVAGRLLTFTAYLNDIEDGGETEFLYYGRRVKPEKGMLCIFPAAFTHTHRGNPPLKDTKYIATGWFEF